MSKSDLHKLVLGLLARPESSAFREPVDWKALGLDDYPDIVARPMDLGTIKKNIETNQYLDVEDIANDIRLVWTNCMLYNRDGSEVRKHFLVFSPEVDFYFPSSIILRILLQEPLKMPILLLRNKMIQNQT